MIRSARVLEVGVTSALGGGPKVMFDLVRRLDRRRFTPIVAIPDDGPFFRWYQGLGVQVIAIRIRGFHPAAVVQLVSSLRRLDIDLVHTHGKGAGLYGRVAAAIARRPCVHTFHGLHHRAHGWLVGRAYLGVEAALARATARLVHVSASEMEEAIALGVSDRGRARLITNGVDTTEIDGVTVNVKEKRSEVGLAPDDVVVGTIARISPQKGLEYLLRAAALVATHVPRARFLLIGDAPRGDEGVGTALRSLILELGIEDRVVLTGYRTDAIELLRCMDLYVSSSLWEGLPITLLEAMACGCPVIATDVSGNRDVVIHGQTGLLVPPQDPRRLAEAIVETFNDEGLQAGLVKGARRLVAERFSLEATVRATENLYDEVLESRSARGRVPARSGEPA